MQPFRRMNFVFFITEVYKD